jgi:hypothetical protein
MIVQDYSTLRYVSPGTRMRKTDYLTQEFHRSGPTEQRKKAEDTP